MINRLLGLAFLTLTLMSSGCAKPKVVLDRVMVKNATDEMITDVKVQHEPTQKIGAVNAILPQKALEIEFPARPLLARQGIVMWRDGEGRQRVSELELPYDRTAAKEGQPMNLIYVICPSGRATVHLQVSAE